MTSAVGAAGPRRTAIALGFSAVLLYAPFVGWGIPHATAPDRTKTFATDEILPLEALAEMHNTFAVSKPDRNYGYPWWHYFVAAAAQAPYVGFLMATGDLDRMGPAYPYGFKDPVHALKVLTIVGRLVSVAMAAGIVVSSFFFARTLWDDLTGVIAAVLTMLNYLMVYYSRTGNLDVPAFFWSAIGLAILATILTQGLTTRRAAMLGLFIALAIATKDQSVALFVPITFVLMVPRFNYPTPSRHRFMPLVVGAIIAACTYVVATGMLVDPRRHLVHVYSIFVGPSPVWGFYYASIPKTFEGTLQLFAGFLRGMSTVMSLPVLLTAVAGFAMAVRAEPWRAVWILPFACTFTLLVWLAGGVYLRYLLPLTLLVDVFAAHALVTLKQTRHKAFVPALVLLCVWRLVIGVDLTYAQVRDTRYTAGRWLAAHAQSGDNVEYFGVKDTMPPMAASIKSRRIMGRERWAGEFGHGPAVLEYLAARGPEFLVVIPDWTSPPGMERSADCPPEVFDALLEGRVGYRLVAYFPTPSLLPAAMRREPLDNPSVAPPVRIFARTDIVSSRGLDSHASVRGQADR